MAERVTEKWISESLLPALVSGASAAGVDASNWTFGQHAGLAWTIYPTVNGSPVGSCVGMWSTLRDAAVGINGMVRAYQAVILSARDAR